MPGEGESAVAGQQASGDAKGIENVVLVSSCDFMGRSRELVKAGVGELRGAFLGGVEDNGELPVDYQTYENNRRNGQEYAREDKALLQTELFFKVHAIFGGNSLCASGLNWLCLAEGGESQTKMRNR
jgi:hypothetical protein